VGPSTLVGCHGFTEGYYYESTAKGDLSTAPQSLAGAIAMTVPPFISGVPAELKRRKLAARDDSGFFYPLNSSGPAAPGISRGAYRRRRRRTVPDEDCGGSDRVSRSNLAERPQQQRPPERTGSPIAAPLLLHGYQRYRISRP
jgi:hypothetical protein